MPSTDVVPSTDLIPNSELILVTGPSGVGKSTVTNLLHQRLDGPDWVLWQADLCQPRHKPVPKSITPTDAQRLEERMFTANLGAIASYLGSGMSVVVELTILTDREAAAVRALTPGRSMIIQLGCGPETLRDHLNRRDTPVPAEWAASFYDQWHGIELPAVKIDVDDRTADEVTSEILTHWKKLHAAVS